MRRATPPGVGVHRAFDEARFGRARTLDLRASLPSAADAETRTEAWLRERQVSAGGEVLVITGRGRGSDGGIPVVRPAVERRLARLRRQGVVSDVREHTAGSFAVTLAPLRALLAASRRKKDPSPAPAQDPEALRALDAETRAVLRASATRSLEVLGVPLSDALLADEMVRHFEIFAAAIGAGPDREALLRAAVRTAMEEVDA